MEVKIYDFDNKPKIVELPDEAITFISVTVLSGDEVVVFEMESGAKIRADASDDRMQDYYDGSYTVKGEKIKDWINWKPKKGHSCSYKRQSEFDKLED